MTATFLRPDADSSDGGWLDASLSSTALFASVDESTYDDGDYIRSSSADGDTVRLRLSDPPGSVNGPLIVRYRCKYDGALATVAGWLTQSTSTSTGLIKYWEQTPTSSFATYTTTLSTSEFDLITDFNDLYVSFSRKSGWWLSGASIDLDFAGNRYYEGTDGQAVTSYLSCSRASIGYAKNADGTLTQFGNDTLRIGVGTGLLVEDARTNNTFYSKL